MRLASPYAVAAGVAVAGFFVVRAATGVPAALAYSRGSRAETSGRYIQAARFMDEAASGANRIEALWRAGQSRLEYWDDLSWANARGAIGSAALRESAAAFLAARAASPGSAWFTSALGDVYTRRARAERSQRPADLDALASGPWALIGDDATIAIGLARTAIEHEPNRFDYRDQLVLLLAEYGLHSQALRAMEESARVLPDFAAHPEFTFESLPRDLLEAFWRTSRALSVDDAPMMTRGRKPLASGQLGRRLGHLVEAEQDLRAALSTPGASLSHAEYAFHLGLVLLDLGRLDEAETLFARAVREPAFGRGVAEMRAIIAGKRERWADALEQLREARRLQPRDLGVLLEFARVAQKSGNWDQADEALRWSILIHPEAPEPHRALVEMLLAMGDRDRARRALDDYVRSFGRTDDSAQLEQALAAPLVPALR